MSCSTDLCPKTLGLPVSRRIIIMIIKPRLADGHTFRMIGSSDKSVNITGIIFIASLIRMHTNAEPYIVICLGDGAWLMRCGQLHTPIEIT